MRFQPARCRYCLFLLVPWAIVFGGGAQAADKPNFVFILADDLGFSDLGCYGGEIETPNLDRLAANGLRFTQFYNTARCWPSRAAFLTGYYPQQVNRDPPGRLPKWASLLPELLKPAGYFSYHSGKWHMDGQVLAAGFERSYLVTDHNNYFLPKHHQIDDKPIPPPGPTEGYYTTQAISQYSNSWLAEHHAKHRGQPFFLYVAFIAPHFPIQALPEDIARYRERYTVGWDVIRERRSLRQRKLGLQVGDLSTPEPRTVPAWNLSEDELRRRIGPGEVGRAIPWEQLTEVQKEFQAEKMAIHAAMIDRLDREVGRVLKQLEAMGVLDDTVVFFASDNGASAEQIIRGDGHDPSAPPGSARSFLCLGPGWSTVSNTPFRRHKYWTHEGGTSTPLIIHWPKGISQRGEYRHATGHFVDLVPTLLNLAGVEAPETSHGESRPQLPGRSLTQFFEADRREPHSPIFFKHEGNRGLRVGEWKIVASDDKSPWELYDLSKDRAESNDLSAQYPEKLKEMADLWNKLDEEYRLQGATAPPGRRPFH